MANEVGSIYVSVMPTTAGLTRQMNKEIKGSFDEAGKSGERSFGQMFRRVAVAGAAILATLGLGRLVKETIALGVEYNTLEQTSRAAFTTILGSADAASEMMGNIREFAKTSPFPRQAFIAASQQLVAFGFEAKQVIPTLSAIQDTVAAIGGSSTEIAAITSVLAKIRSGATLGVNELDQLAVHGLNGYALIAKQMGVTEDAFRDSIFGSPLKGSAALAGLDALIAGMAEKFDGAADNVKNTWLGSVDRIKGAWRDISSMLIAPFIDPEGGGYAVGWANRLADTMRGFEGSGALSAFQERLRDIAASMDAVFTKIGTAISLLSMDDGLSRFVDALGEMFPAVAFINSIVQSLAPVLPALGDALVGVAKALLSEGVLDALVELITEVLPPLAELLVAIAPLIPPLAEVLTAVLVPAASATALQLGTTFDVLKAMFDMISSGFDTGKFVADARLIWTTLGPIGDFAKDIWDNIRLMQTQLVEFFSALGVNVAQAFLGQVSAVKGFLNSIIDAVNKAIRGVNGIAGPLGDAFGMNVQIPTIPRLAKSGTVLPRPGGTLILAAEAGRAESVVDTGKLNDLMDAAANGGGSGITNHWTLNEVTDAVGTAQAVFRRQNSLGAV